MFAEVPRQETRSSPEKCRRSLKIPSRKKVKRIKGYGRYTQSCEKKCFPMFDPVHQKPVRNLFTFPISDSILPEIYCLVPLPNGSIMQDFDCPLTQTKFFNEGVFPQ